MSERGLATGDDGRARCAWGVSAPDYVAYHDDEWGRPVTDDRGIYERLTLEAFQSGLSWLTILRKRENFRAAFDDFALERVARYGKGDVERLLGDAGIVRNRAKIEAAIANAQATLSLAEAGESLAALAWTFRPEVEGAPAGGEVAASTPESKALAKELKRRGFRFVGPTTAYALMQAVGIVNDHLAGCFVRDEVETDRLEAKLDRVLIGERTPGPVTLVEYDPEWPARFEAVRADVAQALGPIAVGIEHIGSTAVAGLTAKPIIDVLVTVESVEPEEAYAAPLVALGYQLRVREDGHRMFRPPGRDVHIHVWAADSAEAEDYLLLRDHLRASSADRASYEGLKRELATRDWPDVNYYAEAKGPLITEILGRVRSQS